MAVDIGVEAENRAIEKAAGHTYINKGGQASKAGNVVSVDIWCDTDLSGVKVGTFYATNGTTFKCRAGQSIAGTITAGSSVNKVVSLDVEIGDYIGLYYSGGKIEQDYRGQADIWEIAGDYADTDDEAVYAVKSGDAVSLGGYISVAAAGRSFGFIIG